MDAQQTGTDFAKRDDLQGTRLVRFSAIFGPPPARIPVNRATGWEYIRTGRFPGPDVRLGNLNLWRASTVEAGVERFIRENSAADSAGDRGQKLTETRQRKRRVAQMETP